MVLTIATLQEVVSKSETNPKGFEQDIKELMEKSPAIFNFIFQDAKAGVKYVKIPEQMESKIQEAKKTGIAEGVIIGIGIVLFFAILGEIFK